ncbi:MAG TPA: hypothetical protein VEY07_01620 [Thermoplasmata archaeon]|nr:hypothetical protein [Thermoplasmata archaeon]
MAGYPTPSPRERPLGVAILAILIGILGALFLLASIALFLFGSYVYGVAGFGLSGNLLIDAVIVLVVAIVLFVVATGLWSLEMWALVLSIIVIGFLWLSNIVTGHLLSFPSLVEVLLLVYLILVRQHFR